MTTELTVPFVEQDCTFEHEGRKFTSGGAAVFGKHAIAYMTSDMRRITTWHGDDIGPAKVVASWPMPYSWLSQRQYQVEATINGKLYTGRTMGGSMLWRGKLKALKADTTTKRNHS
jgi:hypothetical protein